MLRQGVSDQGESIDVPTADDLASMIFESFLLAARVGERMWRGGFGINQSLVQRLKDGRTHVLASCVTKNGIPPRPSWTRLTLPSLYSASSAWMRWTVKRPLVS